MNWAWPNGLLEPQHFALARRAAEVARSAVAPTVSARARAGRFDRDIWKTLGAAGLTGVLVPSEQGGAGCDTRALLMSLDEFVLHGHDVGLAVSLNVHNLIVRHLFLRHATTSQRERYLPGLVEGRLLIALAASEPESGAHPRHLKTKAVRDHDGYRLSGQKAYITNGPEADLLIVIAVTDDTGPRRGITAFLVERESAGLEIGQPMELGFLRTSPHAQLRLNDVPVAVESVLGPEGEAWAAMVRGFRDYEDSAGCGIMTGMLAWQLHATLAGPPGGKAREHDGVAEALADAHSALGAARLCAAEIAWRQDAQAEDGVPDVGALLDAAHREFRAGMDAVDRAWHASGAIRTDDIEAAQADARVVGIAGRVRTLRRRQRGVRLAAPDMSR